MRVELRKLVKRYKDLTVLDGVDYSFPESGMVGILGRSGVGKSTLLQIVGALDRPTSGSIVYGDTDLATLEEEALSSFRGKHIGFVFQFHHLLPEFSAEENVAMPLIIQGVAEEQAFRAASDILDRVGLKARLLHRPGALSGGEQQRVAIARALVGKPPVVLLDEPTGNLDLETAKVVQALLRELQRELNNLMIVVTHSRELAGTLDEVHEMQPGGFLK